jgi:hypothetical protein
MELPVVSCPKPLVGKLFTRDGVSKNVDTKSVRLELNAKSLYRVNEEFKQKLLVASTEFKLLLVGNMNQ